MWALWKLMGTRWLLIIWVVGPSLSSAPLTWKTAWNSVLIIRNLPLVPPVLCLMWFLRALSYLSLEFLTHALLEIIVQPNSMHPSFVEEAVIELLAADCIEEHLELPYCVNPLSVAEGKKLRPVIDLRYVNPCHFRLSGKYECYCDIPI